LNVIRPMPKLLRYLLLAIIAFAPFWAGAQTGRSDDFGQIEQRNSIELYPNPAVDFVFVNVHDNNLKEVTFELHSLIGNKVVIQPEELSTGKYRIPVKNLSNGYYFLVIKDDDVSYKQAYKFLKR